MEATLQKIDDLAAELQSLQPLKPEYQQRLDKKIRLEFNYNSNHIEGNTLTYGETELLLIFDKTTGKHELREYEEMKAHDVAFEMIKEWAADVERPLSEMAVKNLHEILLVRPFWKEAVMPDGQPTRRLINVGTYKEYPNSVRLQNGEMFHYASPEETPIQMGELIEWFRAEEEKEELHPVALAALLHYKFVRIHPFDDGNGRISRLLMNYVLLKHNLPPVIIKSADKKNYLFALNQADAGDLNAFVSYIVEQLIWSLELSIDAAKGEVIDEPEDIDKEIAFLKKTLKQENQLTENKSPEVIRNVIAKTIIPLLQSVEKRCTELKEFFFDYDRKIYLNYSGRDSSYGLGTRESKLDYILKTRVDKLAEEKQLISALKYSYELKGLKKTVNAHHIWVVINVAFNEYNYKIETDFNKNDPWVFSYSRQLSDQDMQKITTPIFQNVIERIKEAR